MSYSFSDLHGRVDFHEDSFGPKLAVTKQQEIPDSFRDRLKHARETARPHQDYQLKASIPVIFVEKWLREGFDVYKEPLSAIVKKCKLEGVEGFLVSHN